MNDEIGYKLGIIWQDVQHRRIVEIIKKLNTNQNVDYKIIFDQLVFYIEDHFDTEEQYMREFAYDKTESHIEEHKTFRNRIFGVTNACFSYNAFHSSISLYLDEWFRNHILVVDKELAVFLLKCEHNNA
jgi:hemerythrin-like metal-binding protein